MILELSTLLESREETSESGAGVFTITSIDVGGF